MNDTENEYNVRVYCIHRRSVTQNWEGAQAFIGA